MCVGRYKFFLALFSWHQSHLEEMFSSQGCMVYLAEYYLLFFSFNYRALCQGTELTLLYNEVI